jgi:plasmid maintenance system antidote protein VapI
LDIQCGREIDHFFVNQLQRLAKRRRIAIKDFETMCINLIHMRYVILPRFLNDRLTNNQDLRIKFLQGEISEEQFKNNIQKRTKKFDKNKEISNIINTVLTTSTEIMYRLADDLNNSKEFLINSYELEIKELIEYINSCFEETSFTYKSKKYTLNKYMFMF